METQTRRLPLLIALVAFVVYLATLGTGVTANNLVLISQLAGWDETPLTAQPLLWLFTLPLSLLPAAWVPLGLKLLAAACAAAILGLLARTVQLLPWDHPWDRAGRLACALPILAAAALCGLEFNFWQEATSSCGDLLDLLFLAAAGWLLLEHYVRRNDGWLDAAALVWGAGMTQNWLMVPALPLFVIAVIFLKRRRFFRRDFALRFVALGLAGFSLYAILPLVIGLSPHSPWTMAEAWLATFHATKTALLFPYRFGHSHRFLALATLIYFLLPTLPLLIRMRDEGTHNKFGVDRFQIWLYRGLRATLLLTCFWLALDPAPGTRQMVHHETGAWLSMLTLDYLVALGAAFVLGNLLLIPHIEVRNERRPRNQIFWQRFARATAAGGVALIAAGLIARNAPAIIHLNYHPLQRFGDWAVKSLPPGRGIILSDHQDQMLLFRMALARSPRAQDWLPVDAAALPKVKYREQLQKRQPAGWFIDGNRHDLTPLETLWVLGQVARSNRLFYLHPSFGSLFEGFQLEPCGTVFEMKPRGADPFAMPTLPSNTIAANENVWSSLWNNELSPLAAPPRKPASPAQAKRSLGVVSAPRDQDRLLADWFSLSLDAWAVTLQKQGRLPEARVRFDQALRLKTNNISAKTSLVCNTNLQAGSRLALGDVHLLATELGTADRLRSLLINDGPIDEPTFDYVAATVFLNRGLRVQAVEFLERARVLAPASLLPQVTLADVYNQLQMPNRSRPLINKLREEVPAGSTNVTVDVDLAMLDSYSWLLETNTTKARGALQSLLNEHTNDLYVANRVINAYMAFNDFSDALQMVEARLAKAPNDIPSLSAKAAILMQSGRPADSIPVLDHVLTLTNEPDMRINRALARIALKDFSTASNELTELEKTGANSPTVDYGFALLAEHAADTNSAQHYLQLCLSNTPPGAPLWRQADTHLRRLHPPVTAR